jgi:hypothetical protein
VIVSHNEIRDELIDPASKNFHLIQGTRRTNNLPWSHAATMPDLVPANPSVTRIYPRKEGEERGDVLIRGLWAHGTDCIIDVRVTQTSTPIAISPKNLIRSWQHTKRRKGRSISSPALIHTVSHFSPFVVSNVVSNVVSTDGCLFGKRAKTLLKRLSSVLSEKWGKSYSEVCGYVNARMSIVASPLFEPGTHLLSTRVPCTNQPYEQPPPPVGRQGRAQLVPPLDFMTTWVRFSHCLVISASYHESRVHLLLPIYVP